MRTRDVARGIGIVAVAAIVVLAATVAGGLLLSSPTNVGEAPTPDAYDTGSLDASPIASDGDVTAPDGESKTVVVDVSHGNDVSEDAIQPFVDALVESGHEVRFYGGASNTGIGAPTQSGSPFNETLRSADALVVVSPAATYDDDEAAGVEAFADAGGRAQPGRERIRPRAPRCGPADNHDQRPDHQYSRVGHGRVGVGRRSAHESGGPVRRDVR